MIDLSLLPDGGMAWLDASGPGSHLVLSTRIRLARNLSNHRFLTRNDSAERLRIFHYAVSLGHQRSLIVYVATADVQAGSFCLDDEHLTRYRQYAGDGLFRVSGA